MTVVLVCVQQSFCECKASNELTSLDEVAVDPCPVSEPGSIRSGNKTEMGSSCPSTLPPALYV